MEESVVTAVNIEDEMKQSYMDYAMSVIIGRALPDVRDGLKPVQRRVLYAMYREGLVHNKKHSKCAGVVGEVLKRFHPHGDASVYDALVRLAQPWSLRYKLVDGQGNFGSIDGDPAAAYRYTECRMTALAESLLRDIDEDTVDFIPNFDESVEEPTVLPSVIPNLLVNGADGIAVGMATHIPPHNLGEVVDGLVALVENPKITLPELMSLIPGPDFPTGGSIYGKDSIVSAYKNGKGIIHIRAKAMVETIRMKGREAEAIVITEIPYQVNKARLIEKIADLVNRKEIEGISRLRDESDRSGMRIVVEVKRDATADVVLNQLYKATPLQSSFGIINLAIVEGRPVVCSLKQLLSHFLDHRRDVVTRRTQFLLKKAKDRLHILEGFRVALANIDEVILIIKGSQNPKDAKEALINRFSLSEAQAQSILELRLQRLTGMERLAIDKEYDDLSIEASRLLEILSDSKRVDEVIVNELRAIKDEFSDARKTEITGQAVVDLGVSDLIEDEDMIVSISHAGYIKRTAVNSYRSQKRGGRGMTGVAIKEDDFIEHLFTASTLADLVFFTSFGRAYSLKVYSIPQSERNTRGRALVNLLSLQPNEIVTATVPLRDVGENQFVFICTKKGFVNRLKLSDLSNLRRTGVRFCRLTEGDSLIGVGVTSGRDDIVLASKQGMAIRFSENDIRPTARGAKGVIGFRLDDDDEVVGMTVALTTEPSSGEEPTLMTVCENGYGKRTNISDYRCQKRGGRGVIDIKTSERNGQVVGVEACTPQTDLVIITSAGKAIRFNVSDVSVVGRNTQGVRLMNLEDEGEKVVAVAPVVDNDDLDEESQGEE